MCKIIKELVNSDDLELLTLLQKNQYLNNIEYSKIINHKNININLKIFQPTINNYVLTYNNIILLIKHNKLDIIKYIYNNELFDFINFNDNILLICIRFNNIDIFEYFIKNGFKFDSNNTGLDTELYSIYKYDNQNYKILIHLLNNHYINLNIIRDNYKLISERFGYKLYSEVYDKYILPHINDKFNKLFYKIKYKLAINQFLLKYVIFRPNKYIKRIISNFK